MAQLNWTYYSPNGNAYLIELYHGDTSGHMLISVNGEIIKIDFNKRENSTHNFMIDNQLIKMEIIKQNKGFEYIVTPQITSKPNVEEDSAFSKQFWIPLIFLLVILNLAIYLYKSICGIG